MNIEAQSDVNDSDMLQLARKFFPQIPPDQILQIIQKIKDNMGGNVSNSEIVGIIYRYINERKEGTSRFQDLAGKMKG